MTNIKPTYNKFRNEVSDKEYDTMTDDEYDNRPWPVPTIPPRYLDMLADQAYAKTMHARAVKRNRFNPMTRDQEDEHLERLMNGDEPLNNKDRAK